MLLDDSFLLSVLIFQFRILFHKLGDPALADLEMLVLLVNGSFELIPSLGNLILHFLSLLLGSDGSFPILSRLVQVSFHPRDGRLSLSGAIMLATSF